MKKAILALCIIILPVISSQAAGRHENALLPDIEDNSQDTGKIDESNAVIGARPFRFEVRAGWGGFPLVDHLSYTYRGFWREKATPKKASLSSLYGNHEGALYMTGPISAEFNFILKRWFTLSLGVSYNGIFSNNYDNYDNSIVSRDYGYVITALPQARFTYFNKPVVKLYSAFGVGLSVGSYQSETGIGVAIQAVPIGIMVGRKVFGFCELGVGSLYMGGMAGIGFRF